LFSLLFGLENYCCVLIFTVFYVLFKLIFLVHLNIHKIHLCVASTFNKIPFSAFWLQILNFWTAVT